MLSPAIVRFSADKNIRLPDGDVSVFEGCDHELKFVGCVKLHRQRKRHLHVQLGWRPKRERGVTANDIFTCIKLFFVCLQVDNLINLSNLHQPQFNGF